MAEPAPTNALRRWTQAGILLAVVFGLAVAVRSVGASGWRDMATVAARIGPGGFLLYCGYSLGVFVLLGAAWMSAAGEPGARLGLFTWGRMVREAASDLLPFSQLGGILLSMRMLIGRGVAAPRVYASFVVDLSTEMASQLVYTLFGLATMASILIDHRADMLRPLILGGTAVMAITIALVFVGQRPLTVAATGLARRFLPGSVDVASAIERELGTRYAARGHVALAFALNLAAWVASAAGAWIVLRLAGVPLSIWAALSLESLIFTLRSVAFAIPGAIGVQEAAYALAGPLFGLSPEAALALALAKRARDLAIAVPTLLVWQAGQVRALARG